ncbi:hypothetical protein BDZ89DRAFT_1136219 [Hymenopellis radicata]|nr:hypothetical protein BDZ89DRAFT_1136219 [Hymenopellis radicata]
MGSSLCGITTLTNPTPPLVFTFSNGNVYDTIVNLASTGIPAYIIAHNGYPCSAVQLFDLQMQSVIAYLEKKTPSITLRGKKMKCRDFLKKLDLQNGIKATAMDTPLGRLHWREHERYGVALCWENDLSMSFPVAYGQPSAEELGLVITSSGTLLMDYILASFVVLHLERLRIDGGSIWE